MSKRRRWASCGSGLGTGLHDSVMSLEPADARGGERVLGAPEAERLGSSRLIDNQETRRTAS